MKRRENVKLIIGRKQIHVDHPKHKQAPFLNRDGLTLWNEIEVKEIEKEKEEKEEKEKKKEDEDGCGCSCEEQSEAEESKG